MKKITVFISCCVLLYSCCKDKNTCKGGAFQIQPFIERYSNFECQNDKEYTYIFTKKAQIDSLSPTCSITSPTAFPIDEINTKYFIIGRMSYYYNDTFNTSLLRDTCLKTLTYEVSMIQRDTTMYHFPNGLGAVQSMFCAVENIPADYKVSINYKYVPLK